MSTPPPGSLGLPFLGEALAFLEDPFAFQAERTRRHGNVWKTRILGDTVVFFAGPEGLGFFLDPDNFTREKGSPPHLGALLGKDAVPFIDGETHKARKRLLLSAFTRDALRSYVPGVRALVARHVAQWSAAGEQPLNPQITQLGFDIANRLFTAAPPELSDTATAADFALVIRGAFSPPVNLPFTAYGKALKACERLRGYIATSVSERDASGTALGVLKDARGSGGESLSRRELEMELLHFFFAAHGGITAALAWLVVVFGQHPEVASRAREEIAGLPAEPSYEDLLGLSYVRAVGREIRRLYPIAPSTFFAVAKRDLEYEGHAIRAGWKAVGAIWPTLQDAATFPDPSTFRAERLTDAALAALPSNAFVPQGGGSPEGHRCAGEAFVELVLPLFAFELLRAHTVELPSQDLRPGAGGLGPLPRGGLRAKIVPFT